MWFEVVYTNCICLSNDWHMLFSIILHICSLPGWNTSVLFVCIGSRVASKVVPIPNNSPFRTPEKMPVLSVGEYHHTHMELSCNIQYSQTRFQLVCWNQHSHLKSVLKIWKSLNMNNWFTHTRTHTHITLTEFLFPSWGKDMVLIEGGSFHSELDWLAWLQPKQISLFCMAWGQL